MITISQIQTLNTTLPLLEPKKWNKPIKFITTQTKIYSWRSRSYITVNLKHTKIHSFKKTSKPGRKSSFTSNWDETGTVENLRTAEDWTGGDINEDLSLERKTSALTLLIAIDRQTSPSSKLVVILLMRQNKNKSSNSIAFVLFSCIIMQSLLYPNNNKIAWTVNSLNWHLRLVLWLSSHWCNN